jgi:alkanesulfonate monooxygenase SsuD/methylene tetrahydromethanopterin reductase-like flavin-dependent oxidoreductase (luciferase family)
LDAPTALASVVSATGDMTLATTIALAVVRGPIPLAKSLGAIDLLSGGRLVVGVGPGSHAPDYEAAGLPWDERWPRFEESIGALRALWRPDGEPFEGTFYSTRGIRLEPPPAQEGGSPGSGTAGSPPPTTPPPTGSWSHGIGCAVSFCSTATIPRRSRTRSPR